MAARAVSMLIVVAPCLFERINRIRFVYALTRRPGKSVAGSVIACEIVPRDVDFRHADSSLSRTCVATSHPSWVRRLAVPANPSRRTNMRVMVIVKATQESEAGKMPSTELLTAMGRFNEELVKAGVMQAGEGLHPSARGKRVRFAGQSRTVVDGPFAQVSELVAGFWVWQVKSIDEAVEWVKRCPNPMEGESEIEIRPIFGAEDFGDALTPELRDQEARLRDEIERSGG
jgi:hypothetical protein